MYILYGTVGKILDIAVLLCLAVIFGVKDANAARGIYAKKLVDDIFLDYNKDVRPVNNTSEAISVNFTVFLFQILELDERNQILTAYLWLRQEWTDSNLSWNSKKYDGLETIRLPSKKVWLPDIVLYNNADSHFTKNLQTNVVITSKGEVRWDQPAITKTSCQMDVSYFPFDSQSCKFTFGSWTFYLEHLDIIPLQTQGNRDDFVPNVEWRVMDMPIVRSVEEYSCCPDPYPIVQITLKLQRKSTFYIFNLLLPCIFISILLPLTFYLPTESGEKVSLGITTLLAMTVFQLLVAESMPPSEAVPLIGKYYITTMALMSFSTATTIFVQNIHFCGPSPPQVPKWMKKYILRYLAGFLNIKVHVKVDDVADELEGSETPEYHTSLKKERAKAKQNSLTHDEKSSILINSKQTSFWPTGAKRCSIENSSSKPNGDCFASAPPYTTTPMCHQTLSRLPTYGKPFTSSSNFTHSGHSSWPRLSEYVASYNKMNQGDLPDPTTAKPSSVASVSHRHTLKRGMSLQSDVHKSTRSRIPRSQIEDPTQSLSRKRQSLIQMNAKTKTADYSDDTEISMITPTRSMSPKLLNFANESPERSESPFRLKRSRSSRYSRNTLAEQTEKETPSICGFLHSSDLCGVQEKVDNVTDSLPQMSSFKTAPPVSRRRSHNYPPANFQDNDDLEATTFQNHSTQTPPCENKSRARNDETILYKAVSENISVIADHFRRQRKVVDNSDEWKSVSRVCDRALMWLFVIIQILFSTLILCKII